MTKEGIEKSEFNKSHLSRKQALVYLGFTAAAAGITGSAAGLIMQWIEDETHSDEGGEEYGLGGRIIKGGRIVSESELVELYNEKIATESRLEADPTIIKSTIYRAMRYFGASSAIAEKRSDLVSLSDSRVNGYCPIYSAECVYDTNSGLGMELTYGAFLMNAPGYDWGVLLGIIAHGSYHMAVRRIEDDPVREDYGVLGTITSTQEKRGFYSAFEDGAGLAKKIIYTGSINGLISVPEEFFAERGRIRYLRHLEQAGLSGYLKELNVEKHTGYREFDQGFANLYYANDPAWPKWWGDTLDPETIDSLHYNNDRAGLFLRIGRHIERKNMFDIPKDLTEGDIRGLGAVAFRSFSLPEPGSAGREDQVIANLVNQPLTKDGIVQAAESLLTNS